MANGASGVIGGRALWKDCISLDRAVQQDRLTNVALPRLREIKPCSRAIAPVRDTIGDLAKPGLKDITERVGGPCTM
jgi:hypothetical protein